MSAPHRNEGTSLLGRFLRAFSSPLVVQSALIVLSLGLQVSKIDHPPIQFEETGRVAAAMANVRGHGHDLDGIFVTWRGHFFRTRQGDHVGAVLDYLVWPVFALFGVSLLTLRLAEILLHTLAAVILARAAARLSTPRAGTLVMFLVLFNASLFKWAKVGFVADNTTMQLFVALTALSFVRWLEAPTPRRAFLWAFAIGWGVYARGNLLWQAVVYILYFALRTARSREKPVPRGVPAFAAGLILSPYSLINISTRGRAVAEAAGVFFRRFHETDTLANVYGGDFGAANYLISRIGLFVASFTYGPLKEKPGAVGLLMMSVPFFLLAWYLWRRKDDGVQRQAVLVWTAAAVTHAAGMSMPAYHGWDAVMPAVPLGILAAGVALDRSVRRLSVLIVVLSVSYGSHLESIRRYYIGSVGTEGPVEYVSDFLLREGVHSPVLLSVFGNSEISVFTEDRVCPRHFTYGGVPQPSVFRGWLSDPRTIYVEWLSPDGTRPGRLWGPSKDFSEFTVQEGLTETDVRVLKDPGGTSIAAIYRMSPGLAER